MKKLFLVSVLFVFLNALLFAQNTVKITVEKIDSVTYRYSGSSILSKEEEKRIKYKWLGSVSNTLTDEMRIKYKKPKGFVENSIDARFDAYPNLSRCFSLLFNRLDSSDKEYVSFLTVHSVSTKQFQYNQKSLHHADRRHVNQLSGIIKRFYDITDYHYPDHIQFFTDKQAKTKFNADSAMRVSFELEPEDYYLQKYKYIDILLLQKQSRGYVYFVSFYTDTAKQNLNWYRKEIESVLRYE